MKDYFPYKDAQLLTWINNFRNKTRLHGTDYGLSAEEIADLEQQSAALEQSILNVASQKDMLAMLVALKNEQRAAFLAKVRKSANRIKAHQNYTTGIGHDFGIITPTTTFNEKSYKLVLTIKIVGGVVRIKYQKMGVDGVNIYRRKRGEVAWQLVTRSTRSPYEHRIQLENPAQPEHWEYRAFGVINDVEVGHPSDIVEVIFGA